MPHCTNTRSWPWLDEPEDAQASQDLPNPGPNPGPAPEPGARPPAHGGREVPPVPDGAPADFRTLRELCHDLTLPATSIRLLASVAVRESDPDPAVRARLQQIADEAARIADICGYFLDPSRWAGPADLRALAADAADSAQLRYPGTIEVVAEPVIAAAHPVDVARILANLLDNACRAAGPDGRVRLVVEHDRDQARLVVADSGRGFGRAEPGRASLGLGIVAALVHRSGGTLRMGTSPLRGLAATVTLPAANGSRAWAAQRGSGGREAR
jgi:signal transduction histidine kinase